MSITAAGSVIKAKRLTCYHSNRSTFHFIIWYFLEFCREALSWPFTSAQGDIKSPLLVSLHVEMLMNMNEQLEPYYGCSISLLTFTTFHIESLGGQLRGPPTAHEYQWADRCDREATAREGTSGWQTREFMIRGALERLFTVQESATARVAHIIAW